MGCASSSNDTEGDDEQEDQQIDYSNIQSFAEGVNVVPISGGDNQTYPKKGDTLTMHYVGTNHGGPHHGKTFDSSRLKGKPFTFVIGQGQVIKGWDEGVIQMCLGQKANLEISFTYGYGADGYGPIGKKQDLLFEVELLAIN
eukprot:788865_1